MMVPLTVNVYVYCTSLPYWYEYSLCMYAVNFDFYIPPFLHVLCLWYHYGHFQQEYYKAGT